MESETNSVTEYMEISPAMYSLLEQDGLKSAVPPLLQIEYKKDTSKLVFSSSKMNTIIFKNWVLEKQINMKRKPLQIDRSVVEFLRSVDCDEMSRDLFISHGITAVYTIENGDVVVIGSTERALAEAEKRVNIVLTSKSITVEDRGVLQVLQWLDLIRSLECLHNTAKMGTLLVDWSVNRDKLIVSGFRDSVKEVSESIECFIEKHTRIEETVCVKSHAVVEFIKDRKSKEWQHFIKSDKVKVSFDPKGPCIKLSGERAFVQPALTFFKSLADGLYTDTLIIKKAGAKKYFTEQGKMMLSMFVREDGFMVVLQEDDMLEEENDFSQGTVGPLGRVSSSCFNVHILKIGHLTLEVSSGDITKEKTDAIVNSSNQTFSCKSGVSKAILDGAGLQVEQELLQMAKDTNFQITEIVTSSGNLPCKEIIHIVGCTKPSDIQLKVLSVLKLCETHKYTSVAFPALGTGQGGANPSDVADAMISAVSEFAIKNEPVHVKSVEFIIFQTSMLADFHQKMQQRAMKPKKGIISRSKGPRAPAAGSIPILQRGAGLGGPAQQDLGRGTDFGAGGKGRQGKRERERDRRKGLADPGACHQQPLGSLLRETGDELFQHHRVDDGLCVASSGQQPFEARFPELLCQDKGSARFGQLQRPEALTMLFGAEADPLEDGSSKIGIDQEVREGQLLGSLLGLPRQQWDHPDGPAVHWPPTCLRRLPKEVKECLRVISWPHLRERHVGGGAGTRGGHPHPTFPVQQAQEQLAVLLLGLHHGLKPAVMVGPWIQQGFVLFLMQARERSDLNKASALINSLINQEHMNITIHDPAIAYFTNEDLNILSKMEKELKVSVITEKKGQDSVITLKGLTGFVQTAESRIRDIIRKVERNEHHKRLATLTSSIVEWQYLSGHDFKGFDIFTNCDLEEAFNQQTTSVQIKIDSKVYNADIFHKVATKGKKRVELKRVELKAAVQSSLPSHWEDMKGQPVVLVKLSADSKEYADVEEEFKKTGLSSNIIKIERVQNSALWRNYLIKKEEMEVKNKHKNNEKLLFHGTDTYKTDQINNQGFNRSFAGMHGATYGNGTYFAVDPSYSAQGYSTPDVKGHKRMYLARVLVGDFTQGRKGIRTPPKKSLQSVDLYDSVTDKTNNPSMFVIFNDVQAYPEYLITFRNKLNCKV
ncbi:protein mono-ADP-ribosyltransferase PARP14-like [Carassius gibelio]|uniref:protein mono-ADP-ribosyltransferase PARP14-like n=1 Tax=Carassius gibelio TaxID=101364 RepID=UPI002278BC91|nr:protein mono-ADP-ribosyltransferase PARP14-like [Carassius gibelio]